MVAEEVEEKLAGASEISLIAKDKSHKKDKKDKSGKNDKKHKKDKKDKKRTREESSASCDIPADDKVEKKHKKDKKKDKSIASSLADEIAFDSVAWYKEHDIAVSDDFEHKDWKPVMDFKATGLSTEVLDGTKGFSKPTPIQSVCWPIILSGRHIIGIAETGSGKTLAFGLPAAEKLRKSGPAKLPSVLIMTPTRELAMQIQEQFDKFTNKVECTTLSVFGGTSKQDQRNALRKGVDIIIACPGRLADIMQEGSCSLENVSYVILDEADRLLDSGFEKEVRYILGATNKQRQIAMFSATWPSSIQKLANDYLKNAVKVTVGSPELGANGRIAQIVEVLDPNTKEQRLLKLLREYHSTRKNRILVFALYKKEAARLEQFLQRNGWNCVSIHGDMSQDARSDSFYKFKSGEVPLLIATDVAARGLDIPNVEYVINCTFPLTIEDYVHRIGRTGRAGKSGIAHTFFTVHDKLRCGELVNVLKQTGQEVPEDLMQFGTAVKKKEHSVYGAFYKDIDPNVKGTKMTFDD